MMMYDEEEERDKRERDVLVPAARYEWSKKCAKKMAGGRETARDGVDSKVTPSRRKNRERISSSKDRTVT
jgi:hypothetical protein